MPDRYYSSEPIIGSSITLGGSEAHHLLHVMRAQPGLELIVFDGRGGEYAAHVSACQRSTVEVELGEHRAVERELPFELTLAVALPKGDRQRWLVEKCTELGVTKIIPLQLARSASKGEKKEKLSRYIIEASKQCGRNQLMEINEPKTWTQLLDEISEGQRILAHPSGQPLAASEHGNAKSEPVCIAIGPEGGFTDEEVSQASEVGWDVVGLGERILRIETAAVALATAIALD